MSRPAFLRSITFAAPLAVTLVLALPPSHAVAADEAVAPDALAPGSSSVQFSVQPNFTLGTYSGSTLSLKRHRASGNAIRFGVSVGVNNLSDDFVDVLTDPTQTRTMTSTFDGNVWSFGVNALYLWYSHRASPVHAYWGLGPSVSWLHGHDERLQSQVSMPSGGPTATSSLAEDIKSTGWTAGIGGALGVEWLVARRVGLIAEYGTSFSYSRTNSTRVATQTPPSPTPPATTNSERRFHRWDLSSGGGMLGVSVYY
jgi:hypothetical protein